MQALSAPGRFLIQRRVKTQPFLKEFLSWHHDRLVALLPVLIALARCSLYTHFTLNMLVSMVSCSRQLLPTAKLVCTMIAIQHVVQHWLDNRWLISFLSIVLAAYGGFATPKLTPKLQHVMTLAWFRAIVIFVLAYTPAHDVHIMAIWTHV